MSTDRPVVPGQQDASPDDPRLLAGDHRPVARLPAGADAGDLDGAHLAQGARPGVPDAAAVDLRAAVGQLPRGAAAGPVPALHPQHRHDRRSGHGRDAAQLLLLRVRVRPAQGPRSQRHLPDPDGHADAAHHRHPGADLHRVQPPRLAEHVQAADPAGVLRLGLLHLLVPAVLPRHPQGAGGGRPDRRRRLPADLVDDLPAAVLAGDRHRVGVHLRRRPTTTSSDRSSTCRTSPSTRSRSPCPTSAAHPGSDRRPIC